MKEIKSKWNQLNPGFWKEPEEESDLRDSEPECKIFISSPITCMSQLFIHF